MVRGEADVINHHPDGRDIFLGKMGEGNYFDEIGLLQGRPRVATVPRPATTPWSCWFAAATPSAS
jgi:CRP-like cAMP-binding protein